MRKYNHDNTNNTCYATVETRARADLPWFCKTFPTPISEDLEVRICTDQDLNDENVAIESFELYIQGEISKLLHATAQDINIYYT